MKRTDVAQHNAYERPNWGAPKGICLSIQDDQIFDNNFYIKVAADATVPPDVCVSCRNINHEKLDAFMCNECGHSRFGKFELSLSASPCVSYPPILNQDDMMRALGCLEHNVSAAQTRCTGLSNATRCVFQEALLGT